MAAAYEHIVVAKRECSYTAFAATPFFVTHINDISPRNYVEVCIDGKHAGVGGYDSWGARPEQKYLIPANENHGFAFVIKPM